MRGAIRLLLGPVLLWQGRQVRRNILRLPEADGPRQGVAGKGPDLRLLIIGDSSAAGVGAAEQQEALTGQLVKRLSAEHRVTWRLIAGTGWTTADALHEIRATGPEPFDLVILSLGVNDVTTETGLTLWTNQYGQLVEQLHTRFEAGTIIASGLPPMGRFPALPQPLRWYLGLQVAAYDGALSRLAALHSDVHHLPLSFSLDVDAMAEDGFHPGPKVYAEWADLLSALIFRTRPSMAS